MGSTALRNVVVLLAVLAPPTATDARAQDAAAEDTAKDSAGTDAAKPDLAARLSALLTELKALPAQAWQAHIAALQQRAEAQRAEAAELRKQADELRTQADRIDKEAAARLAEVARFQRMQSLLAEMPAHEQPEAESKNAPAKKAAAEPAAAKPPAAAPKDADKPAAKPAEPKKDTAMAAKTGAKAEPSATETLVNYDDHVFPIFDLQCATCHEPGDSSGGLVLTTFAGARQGGSSGKTLMPGDPDQSRLFLLVSHREKPFMPKDEPRIPDEQIETIRAWIAQGAPENAQQANEMQARRAAEQAAAHEQTGAAAPRRAVMPVSLESVEKDYPDRPAACRTVAASANAPLVAFPGHGQVLLMHADSGAEIGVLPFGPGHVEGLRFSPDGARLVAAGGLPGKTGGAVLYDVESGRVLRTLGETRDSQLAAAVTNQGVVAVGGTRSRVDVFGADGELSHRVAHDDWVLSVDVSPDGALLASADRAGKVLVTELETGREVHELTGHAGPVHQARFRADGAVLATCSEDRTIRGFRMRDGRQLWSKQDRGPVHAVAWIGADQLATAGAGIRPRIWIAEKNESQTLPPIDDWVYGFACSHDEARLFAADWRGRLTTFDVSSRKVVSSVIPLAAKP